MPTIHDVAKLAGVAPITVSRVINDSGYISEETRRRVELAVKDLGYLPNRLASSLRSKRTNTLALILTDITNPFFTTLARGVEDTASDSGFTVIFCNTDESEVEEQKYLQVLLQKQVDGILLVPASSSPESVDLIRKQDTAVVVLDRRIPDAHADIVRCDSEAGAYQLTKLLLSLGHERIAVLSGPQNISTAADRVAGYQRAMLESGFAQSRQIVCFGEFNQASGYELTHTILTVQPRPTAIFAANNFIAIGALKAIQDQGLRVPQDIALVGFDDLPPALVTFPFFTVASQPAYEMGCRATQLLLARLNKTLPEKYEEVVLPTEIIIRQSSGHSLQPQSQ